MPRGYLAEHVEGETRDFTFNVRIDEIEWLEALPRTRRRVLEHDVYPRAAGTGGIYAGAGGGLYVAAGGGGGAGCEQPATTAAETTATAMAVPRNSLLRATCSERIHSSF